MVRDRQLRQGLQRSSAGGGGEGDTLQSRHLVEGEIIITVLIHILFLCFLVAKPCYDEIFVLCLYIVTDLLHISPRLLWARSPVTGNISS